MHSMFPLSKMRISEDKIENDIRSFVLYMQISSDIDEEGSLLETSNLTVSFR